MRVFVAGATGAVGRPLVAALLSDGHEVIGMSSSEDGVRRLKEAGAEGVLADALDPAAVAAAVAQSRPDAMINQLTSLPAHYTPEEMRVAAQRDSRLRLDGGRNLLEAAVAAGVRRYIVQSSGFYYAPGPGLATETDSFAFDATPRVASGSRVFAEVEKRVFETPGIEGVALRYGFYYGPGTWFTAEGDAGEQVLAQKYPIIGEGHGVWSWVYIKDAAWATVGALRSAPGVYNVADDQPMEQAVWLPAFARFIGAPPPPRVSEEEALRTAGPDAVYYATRLRGASNEKARRELGFVPRPMAWWRPAAAKS